MKDENNLPLFDEYLRAQEPGRREKAYAWKTAIGLQKVDGLTPSDYLIETARRNIEGEITLAESRELVTGYHKETTEYLELFFRNLLLGEENELQNRYMLVGGWHDEGDTPTSTPTSKRATPTSSRVAQLAFSEAIRRLLSVLEGELSRGRIMTALKLKDRVSFVDYYLSPALKIGLVEMTQPDSPRSPTQKYRLTAKGLAAKEAFE